jgi:hypothetical protein
MPPTLQALRDAVAELNQRFPRPGLVLVVGEPWDIHTRFAEQYPDCEKPGVYALIANDGIEVLRIGKAQHLGFRFGAYFMWANRRTGQGRTKDHEYDNVQYIVTVPLPVDRSFEAPSIEEFLLGRFRESPPRLNVRLGRDPLDI